MKIVIENNIKTLVPSDENKWLIAKTDLELPEEERYYFKVAYLPNFVTLEECEQTYTELERAE